MLTTDLLLRAYAIGLFPMAESRESETLHWIDPPLRGIFPLDRFHISRSLRRALLRSDYDIRVDTDFAETVLACADRPETWINPAILDVFNDLHRHGHAHSIEVWRNGIMIGGVYGLALGTAFFGESMFSRERDASKIALAWLVHRLRAGRFTLFDTQFLTPHLQTLGGVEIPKMEYVQRLEAAIRGNGVFAPSEYAPTRAQVADQFVQDRTHTS
ncbi:leucyl/phenylalanyl-tRNA--protein transferase [Falsirhodobacter halotolerans]|uniref:leucyl/phenylalanyl-tRNA--protein transferase n=1 Tax=Falsirhodobacter halotolerans TaxID=1146892 RepID=UPI001FD589FB|nr:leucyl/phenylalanyl-tRNA--protein transferase [Falsirhodobacter halotolerans]MCJ8139477.1 leucyl/phenylalanyl-tRNA--protein transferase [Falsirhodobacter halotolerans]